MSLLEIDVSDRWKFLTPQELQIVRKFVVEDAKVEAIASDMKLSRSRVKQLVSAIYRILNVRTRIELIFWLGRNWDSISETMYVNNKRSRSRSAD